MDKEKEKEKGSKSRTLKSAWSMLLPVSASKRSSNSFKKASTDEVSIEHDCNVEKITYEPFSSSVEFLNLGFQELVKCRQVRLLLSLFFVLYLFSLSFFPSVCLSYFLSFILSLFFFSFFPACHLPWIFLLFIFVYQILRGSFAYAFYAYSDEDDPDVTKYVRDKVMYAEKILMSQLIYIEVATYINNSILRHETTP